MGDYTRFRVVEDPYSQDTTYYKVQVRGWFGWRSAYMATGYFLSRYDTKEAALKAIEGYKSRHTEVE